MISFNFIKNLLIKFGFKNKNGTVIKIKYGTNIEIINNKFSGFKTAIDAEKVKNLKTVDNEIK